MVVIEGYIRNSVGQPLAGIPVEAFKDVPLIDDRNLNPNAKTETTNNEGYFKIIPQKKIDEINSNVYIIIIDISKKFVSVRDRHNRYKRKENNETNAWNWRSPIFSNLNNIIEIVVTENSTPVAGTYNSVIIGSGFGGTVVALAIAKMYKKKNENGRVCMLEQGQWWISPEVPDSDPMRTYLMKNNMPFGTWAYPNDIKAMLATIGNSRTVNKVQGLYDVKRLKNVNIISGCGVGGGSLVYFNITEKPEHVVYENWPTEHDGSLSLDEFYPLAEKFIGVSTITTTAGLGSAPLPKAKVFQDAAKKIGSNKIINLNNMDAKLSITDISTEVFDRKTGRPNQEDIEKYTAPIERNICERQGRCGLGCIPYARHTLNKHIFSAIHNLGYPIDVHPLCQVLEIEELPSGESYKYAIKFIDYRDLIDAEDYEPSRDLKDEERAALTKVIKTNQVILAAGTLGSTEILLRSKKLKLSDTLGERFSTNGDFFGIINPTKYNVDSSKGPTQTSVARFKDSNNEFIFSIEDVGIPQMFADVFATIFNKMREQKGTIPSATFRPHKSFTTLFSELVLNNININDPQTGNILAKLMHGFSLPILYSLGNIYSNLLKIFSSNLTPEERVSNMLVLFGTGRDYNNTSKLFLGDGHKIELDNEYNLRQPVYDQILNGMRLFAEKIGKEGEDSLITPLWDTQISAHPLGGCSMGSDSTNGVVDSLGRVFRRGENKNSVHDGLYVADGSIIPTSLGVNPSLSIIALAFRIAFHIVGKNKDYLP